MDQRFAWPMSCYFSKITFPSPPVCGSDIIFDEFLLAALFKLFSEFVHTFVYVTMSFYKGFFCLTTLRGGTICFLFGYNLPYASVMGCPLTLVLGERQSSLSICPFHGTQHLIHLQYVFPVISFQVKDDYPCRKTIPYLCQPSLSLFQFCHVLFEKGSQNCAQCSGYRYTMNLDNCILFSPLFSFSFLGIFNIVFISKHWDGIFIGLSVITFYSWIAISELVILCVKIS